MAGGSGTDQVVDQMIERGNLAWGSAHFCSIYGTAKVCPFKTWIHSEVPYTSKFILSDSINNCENPL
jgi:hypothetical protein